MMTTSSPASPVPSADPHAPATWQAGPRLAVVCPGQGSLRRDTGQWLTHAPVAAILAELAAPSHHDLPALLAGGEPEALTPTDVAQPLTLALSLASAVASGAATWDGEALTSPAPVLGVVAGHSLGYLTAAALAGCLTPHEAVDLAYRRGTAMARCCREHPGTMVAIVSREPEAMAQALAEASACGLQAANTNSPTQVVVAGSLDAAARLAARTLPRGVRALPVPVAGAFHTAAMSAAAEAVTSALAALRGALSTRRTTVDLIDDTDGRLIAAGTPASQVLDRVAAKITAPVRWDLVTRTLRGRCDGVVELAPSGTLAALARRALAPIEVTALTPPPATA